MKLIKQSENEYFGRLELGEELKSSLEKFCEDNDIQSAWFQAIGAVQASKIAFYDQKEKKYLAMTLEEEAEILNCTGDIALFEGKPIAHAHITLSDREGKAYGGHLINAKIFAGEIYLKKFDKPLERKKDAATGLNLLDS